MGSKVDVYSATELIAQLAFASRVLGWRLFFVKNLFFLKYKYMSAENKTLVLIDDKNTGLLDQRKREVIWFSSSLILITRTYGTGL